ncbi:MAG: HNH endonuclease [Brachybacterium sp.]|uniref:HNH endonuclease signature motif containing protein n=1 Tax=Brachybacterium sp. TaxID=1891286 RepID=UPI00264999B4|nr:HNH endonuclease signature motif containing protein [Brachybacterium sp.]MDN5686019.1 HNH endonuclease [Brachybacterium sp.]
MAAKTSTPTGMSADSAHAADSTDSAESAATDTAHPAASTKAPRTAGPPRTPVDAHTPLDPDTFAAHSHVEPGCVEEQLARELFATHHEEALAYAGRLRKLAMLWDDTSEEGDMNAILVADARRITLDRARTLLRDAATAVVDLPHTLARLEAGQLPVSWFEQLLRRTRRLTSDQRRQVDDRVAEWDLENITADRFSRELGKLIAWFGMAAVRETPTEQRDVSLEINPDHDGTACLLVTGPIHEMLDLSRRLDLAARAVQNEQRHAAKEGRPAPFDIDGDVARTAYRMPLAALRYAILTRTMLEASGVQVPQSRFRLQVIVPAMTLLGESDAPGTIDGTIPLPARMARHLAADEPTWYRILTDPSDGAYLPLPPTTYSPTTAMAEHLRLLDPICAVPGCTNNVCTIGEADHIEEYDHRNPEKGGQTALENLHRLCWTHHDMKTRGLLDPVRGPDGTTTWHIGDRAIITTDQNRDLLTPELAAALQSSWEAFEDMRLGDDLRLQELGLLEDTDPADPSDPPDGAEPAGLGDASGGAGRAVLVGAASFSDPPF